MHSNDQRMWWIKRNNFLAVSAIDARVTLFNKFPSFQQITPILSIFQQITLIILSVGLLHQLVSATPSWKHSFKTQKKLSVIMITNI